MIAMTTRSSIIVKARRRVPIEATLRNNGTQDTVVPGEAYRLDVTSSGPAPWNADRTGNDSRRERSHPRAALSGHCRCRGGVRPSGVACVRSVPCPAGSERPSWSRSAPGTTPVLAPGPSRWRTLPRRIVAPTAVPDWFVAGSRWIAPSLSGWPSRVTIPEIACRSRPSLEPHPPATTRNRIIPAGSRREQRRLAGDRLDGFWDIRGFPESPIDDNDSGVPR